MFLLDVCQTLERKRISYALVGGYAVALHGAVRGTIDIDLVVALDFDSLEKVTKALEGLGLQSRLPLNAKEVAEFRQEYIKKRNLIAWSFVNPKNPAQLVDLILTEDIRKIKVVKMEMNGFSLRIIAKPDLIRMKKASGRPQDLADVEMLLRED